MMTGQKVMCIDDVFHGPIKRLYVALPVKGETYTVRAMFPARSVAFPLKAGSSDGEIGILLDELHNPPDPKQKDHQELAFKADRFRPLETLPDETVKEQLPDLIGVNL